MSAVPRRLAVAMLLLAPVLARAEKPSSLAVDHVWIMVSPGAPEREGLKSAGFQIAKEVNRHDGQGTASITVEFENGYLELMWPDSSVKVAPGKERAAAKFRQRMSWRTSGWCPIGIGLRRTKTAKDSLPFPTWSWTAPWMPKGSSMVMLTAREDTLSPALFIEPPSLADTVKQAARGALYDHPIGCRRITGVWLIYPGTYQPTAALQYLQRQHLVNSAPGDEWRVEVTFDGTGHKKRLDLRPGLPLLIRY